MGCFSENRIVIVIFICLMALAAGDLQAAASSDTASSKSIVTIFSSEEGKAEVLLGRGFVIGERGVIVTTAYIAAGYRKAGHTVYAKKNDGSLAAIDNILLTDEKQGLALMKISEPELPSLALAKGPGAKHGDRYFLIPFTPGQTVLMPGGSLSLSGKRRSGLVIPRISSPSREGSPICNAAGEVIGMVAHETGVLKDKLPVIPVQMIARAADIYKKEEMSRIYFELGKTYETAGRQDDALKAYEESLRLKPDNAEVYNNMGVLQSRKGDQAGAMLSFEKAVRSNPEHGDAHNNLGVAYGKAGKYNEAISALNRAISLKPHYAEANFNLGIALTKTERFQEAAAAFLRLLQWRPDDTDALNRLALVYMKLERNAEAADTLKKALALKPANAEAHFRLGLIYLKLGDTKAAEGEYEDVSNLDPDFAIKLRALIHPND